MVSGLHNYLDLPRGRAASLKEVGGFAMSRVFGRCLQRARRLLHGLSVVVVLTGLAVPALTLLAQPAEAATEAVSLSQCTNGGVGPPLVLNPCLNGTLGTSFSDWVNGNANSAKSHWKEGQF